MDRTSNRRLASLPLGLAAILLATVTPTAPAKADWLVTREGARIETRGSWQEKGNLVVFTLPDGTLSSLRADSLDLDASRRATAESKVKTEQAPAPKPKRRSVRSLTDKDFRQAAPAAVEGTTGTPAAPDKSTDEAAPGEEAKAAPGEEASSAPNAAPGATQESPDAGTGNPLEVVTWERAGTVGQGVRLTGMLRNNSADQVTGIELVAGLYDETGALLVRKAADLEAANLGPGESTSFLVDVPDTFTFSAVKFQMRSTGFKLRALPPAGPTS